MSPRQTSLRLALAALVCVLTSSLFGGPASAQGRVVVTGAQQKLANRAAASIRGKKYDKAVQLLERSLALGQSNAAWMNLGRAQYYAGRCQEAAEAFGRAEGAPQVVAPSPTEIAAALARYRSDLERTCPGSLLVWCSPATLTVTVDGGAQIACNTSVTLPAGPHRIAGRLNTQEVGAEIVVRGTRTTESRLEVPPDGLVQAAQEELAVGRYESARDLSEMALAQVDSSLGRVVRARALFKLGECRDAARELRRAADAPLPEGLKLDDVLRRRDEYLADLEAGCPGYVSITCDPDGVVVQVDGDRPAACPTEALALGPGPHEIIGFYGGSRDPRAVTVSALDETELTFAMSAPADLGRIGWIVAGSGAALLVAGAALDVAVLAPMSDDRREAAALGNKAEFESLTSDVELGRGVIFAAYGLGWTAVATGAVLWWLRPDDTPDMTSTGMVAPLLRPDGAGAIVRLPW